MEIMKQLLGRAMQVEKMEVNYWYSITFFAPSTIMMRS